LAGLCLKAWGRMFLFSTKMCANCIHHRAGDSPFTGTCAQREWQPAGGVIRLVRENELACYGGWGVDSFEPKAPGGGDAPGGNSPGGGSNGPRNGTIGPGGRYVAQAGGRVLSPELVDKLLAVSPGRNRSERGELQPWDEETN
jgi:hypothetical protein